ncbi:MAG: hypothetical protein ACJAQT_001449 [Akkermansiaceae bacterium]|jgi:hypothetical protein
MKPLGQKRRRLAGVLDRSGSDVPRRGEQAGGAWESNVKTAASNEFEDVEFEDGGFLGGAVGPLEEDVAVRIVAEDSFSTEGGALDVTGKVAEGGFSTTDGLKLDVPLGLGIEGAVLVWGQFGENVRVICFEGALDEAAEAGGERQVVDEEVLGSRKGLQLAAVVLN